MTKIELLSFINKYSLGGNVESVAWELKNDTIATNFVSSDKTLKGTVTMNNAKINSSEQEIGIYTTSQLVRMLSILDNDVNVTVSDTSMQVNDKYTDFSFVLADLDVIPKSNRISFNIDIDIEDVEPIHFSSGLMREILVANKGTHGTLEISPVGLGRVKFNTAATTAEYYLVSKQID